MTAPPPPVVLLHGFGQNGRCWGPFGEALAVAHEVDALDLPGHGAAAVIEADLPTTADLVADSIRAARPAIVIGYSMGGRAALHVALAHPRKVAGLVLISATAGITDDDERAARVAADEALAAAIEADGVDAFVERWLALPLFAGLPPEMRFDDERRTNSARGLATSLRRAGTGTQEPLWGRLADLTMPVLLLAGAEDEKFTAIARHMAEAIGPNAALVVVDGAGHSVHLEQPTMTAAIVNDWMAAQAR